MRYFNSDGKEAAMCGNGARCVAWFVSSNKILTSNAFILQAKDGQHRVEIQGDKVRLNLNPTSEIKTGFNLIKEQGLQEGGYIEVGVPHYVIFTDKVEDINLREKAPYYRHNSAFSRGVNVNYVQYLGNSQIRVRTFERGVEDETLSCGTGCVASALIASQHFQMKSPVTVITRGGELEVEFKADFKEVFLIGPAKVVYEGVI
jgi:diaminopimelate epimerase